MKTPRVASKEPWSSSPIVSPFASNSLTLNPTASLIVAAITGASVSLTNSTSLMPLS